MNKLNGAYCAGIFLSLSLYLPSLGAVTLDIRGGILYGADEVQVGSTLYDVDFRDGTCIDLYGNCDEASDFPFSTRESAAAANLALLEQVFLDSAAGLFDSDPTLTFGCENARSVCRATTPVGDREPSLPFGASSPEGGHTQALVFNNRLERLDTHTGFGSAVRASDTTNSTPSFGVTRALWNLSSTTGGGGGGGTTTPAPIPATLYLFLIGLVALVFRHKYK